MPADISVLDDPELAQAVRHVLADAAGRRLTRMKLFKLAWDMVGSEFAGRHLQYEKFYAGASFIIRNHSLSRDRLGRVQRAGRQVMAGYDVPKAGKRLAAE